MPQRDNACDHAEPQCPTSEQRHSARREALFEPPIDLEPSRQAPVDDAMERTPLPADPTKVMGPRLARRLPSESAPRTTTVDSAPSAMDKPPERVARMPELDGLRGIAAIGVVATHMSRTGTEGWTFTDCFLVLTGLLVTTPALKGLGRPSFAANFWLRRMLRVLPAYYAVVLFVWLANQAMTVGYDFSLTSLFQHLTLTQYSSWYVTDLRVRNPNPLAPTWCLAAQEQFCLIWVCLLSLFGRRAALPMAAGFLLLGLAARAMGTPHQVLLARFDGLGLGCMLAILLHPECVGWRFPDGWQRVATRWLLLLLVLGAVSAFVAASVWTIPAAPSQWTARYSTFGLTYGALIGLIVLHSGHWALFPLRFWPVRMLGLISYSIYLWHFPVLCYLPPLATKLGLPEGPATPVAVILLVSIAAYWLLERPAEMLRQRWLKR